MLPLPKPSNVLSLPSSVQIATYLVHPPPFFFFFLETGSLPCRKILPKTPSTFGCIIPHMLTLGVDSLNQLCEPEGDLYFNCHNVRKIRPQKPHSQMIFSPRAANVLFVPPLALAKTKSLLLLGASFLDSTGPHCYRAVVRLRVHAPQLPLCPPTSAKPPTLQPL